MLHTTAFNGRVVDHWLEQKITQTANASAMQDPSVMQEDPFWAILCPKAVICAFLPVGKCI